jgi:hypothetical protein
VQPESATIEEAAGDELAALFGPAAGEHWLCNPCERATRTLVSLREPCCPFCGRKYRPEYQRG